MPAKLIQISDDAETTWYTLPGGTGAMTRDGAEIEDTIFGQSFQSQQAGLIDLGVSANALYKGFAGYVATIEQQGTPTGMTAESMTLVSGKTYKIDDASKEIWDVNDGVTPLDILDTAASVDVSDIESINYLFGEVTFKSSYSPGGAITVTGTYLPTSTLGKGNSLTLTQTANAIDNSDFAAVQANGGYLTREPGLRTVSLTLDGIFAAANGLIALLEARTTVIIEINPDGNGKSVARGFFQPTSDNLSGDVGALEEESVDFALQVLDAGALGEALTIPFGWQHANDSTLSQSIQRLLTEWEAENLVDVQYLYDGVNGWKMNAVITDLTMTTGLAAMNEFAASFSSNGAPTAVP